MVEALTITLILMTGILAGTITGLIPGIHVNTLAAILIALSTILLTHLSPILLVIFIVSMAITHTFLNFLPSIYLGAPDQDTALSILPGHDLLNEGKGYSAILYSLHGSLLGLLIILILTPVFIYLLPLISSYLTIIMFLILMAASLYLILREKQSKFLALTIFSLSGFLGLASNNLIAENSLLPLLTGLFGASSLLTSILKKEKIPHQKTGSISEILRGSWTEIKHNFKKFREVAYTSILAAPLCCFLPSLGTSQAAVIGSDLVEEIDRERFLTLLGSINTIVAGLAFITLYSIQEARTGAVVAIEKLIPLLTTNHLFLILSTITIAGLTASLLTVYLGKYLANIIPNINYTYLSVITLTFLSLLTLYFTGLSGLLVFIISSCLGLSTILLGIRRTHLMGSIMLPTILFYLPF